MYSVYVNRSADGADLRIHHASRGDQLAGTQFWHERLWRKRTVACIVLSCHGVFCSGGGGGGGGGALLCSQSSRSKGRQPCQHTSAKHTEFISDARRGGQINKYRSQTQRSGCRGLMMVVVCVGPKSWMAKTLTIKSLATPFLPCLLKGVFTPTLLV